MKAESEKPRPFGTGYKLIGKDYATPDMVAKVTGGEVCRGFSRRGNAVLPAGAERDAARRIRSMNSEALAMPGVKAVLTPDDIPAGGLPERQRQNHQGEQVGRAGADQRADVPGRTDSGRGGGG
jgi:CO/xanthine dehydrogenase Mo-binding subunit